MKYCTNCGAKLPEEGLYCPECGKRIIDRIEVKEDGKGGLVFDVPEGTTVTIHNPDDPASA